MRLISRRFFTVMTILLTVWTSSSWAINLTETWYMSRGESNMEIKNYKAAIEAFEKVVATNPDNQTARRNLGLAYEAQGLRDKAAEQYDKYLEKKSDDGEINLRQAEILSTSRYHYRKKDALKYYREGLKHKDSLEARRKYASLLASDKETSHEAVEQYKIILSRSPNDRDAYRGLAKAYAWTGDQDQALYYSELAHKKGAKDTDLATLETNLNKSRRPEVFGRFTYLEQPGDINYRLHGYRLGVGGKHDVGPFVTLGAELGHEDYWHVQENASGPYFSLSGEYRQREDRKATGALDYFTMQPIRTAQTATTSVGNRNLTGRFAYQMRLSDMTLTPGFERTRKEDSFLSLAGSHLYGSGLGVARSNLIYLDFEQPLDHWTSETKPYVGWVSALSVSDNQVIGVSSKMTRALTQGESYQLNFVGASKLEHYGQDQSDFSGQGAGYFSPQIFLSENPGLEVHWQPKEAHEVKFNGGPSVQFVRDDHIKSKVQLAGEVNSEYLFHVDESLFLQAGASYIRVANVFSRFELTSALYYKF